mgnify:CR=1 FL=1
MDLRCNATKLAEIAGKEKAAFVVLFGSLAKGQAGAQSDVDIGIMYKQYPEHPYESFRNLTAAFENDNLDMVDLNQENPLLHFRIATEGKVLWQENPFAFRRFQNEASKQYADTAKFRRLREQFMKDQSSGHR